jgi:hypothetical protein
MQRLATLAARMGPPRCLAVDGDDVGRMLAQGFDPVGKARLEEFRVEPVDHVIERVVGRDAALVGQEPPQEIEPLFAPQPDLHEILHARQRGAQHKQQNLRQRIEHTPTLARVRQRRKVIENCGRWPRIGHGRLRIIEATHESYSFVRRAPVNLKRLPCTGPDHLFHRTQQVM